MIARIRYAAGAFLVGSLALYGCGSDSGGGPDGGGGGGIDAPAVTGPYTHFATSSVKIGKNTTDAVNNGFDLTGDGKVDNALGKALAGLSTQIDIDTPLAQALTDGDFVILHSLHGDATNAAAATWQVYLGDPFVAPAKPDLTSGTGMFSIASTSPTNAIIHGAVQSGKFVTTSPGNLTLQLSLVAGMAPLQLSLKAARLEATISGNTCTGKLGGGILAADLTAVILPALASQLNTRLAADVETTCPTAGATCQAAKMSKCCSSTNNTILSLFDTDGNYMITTAELTANTLVAAILQPDVDILDAAGNVGKDNTPESVSIGLGFTCVKGMFTASSEH